MRFAAIDIGSNSILLTIAEQESGKLRVLEDLSNIVGLSKGLAANDNHIEESRIRHAEKVVSHYYQRIKALHVDQFHVTATAVFRRASNGALVKDRIEKILGQPIELLSGDREATLSFVSVAHEYQTNQKFVVFDIGGASTELCYGLKDQIMNRISLPIGCAVLTDQFNMSQPHIPRVAVDHVSAALKSFNWHHELNQMMAIGVAGTMTSLAAMTKKIQHYSRAEVTGVRVSEQQVSRFLLDLAQMTTPERAQIKGLQADRADVMTAGLTIILTLMQTYSWPEVICVDAGIRFGILHEINNKN